MMYDLLRCNKIGDLRVELMVGMKSVFDEGVNTQRTRDLVIQLLRYDKIREIR